jgi:phosphatidylinositol alpha-1,6-mannosyltransferase
MKVLHLTLEYPPQVGGIASYVINFALHTLPQETVVFAPVAKNSTTIDGAVPFTVYRRQPYWFLWPHWARMLFQTWRIVTKESITSIYVHQVLPGGYVALALKKMLHIPYTIFLHGTDLEKALATKFKKNRLEQILNEAERVVVNSHFLEQKLQSRCSVLRPVSVLYPAPADVFFESADEDAVRKLKAELALQGKKIILTVGRMVEGKGHMAFARLLPRLLTLFPDLVWLVVGEGPEQKQCLDALAKHDVQHVVRFLGSRTAAELKNLYHAADLFLLLSSAGAHGEEGWGTVFAEAAACGIPVVAGRAGGTEEAVPNPPSPILESNRYFPSRTVPGNAWASAEKIRSARWRERRPRSLGCAKKSRS